MDPVTLLFCGESVRPGAKRTVAWLRRQDVRCRVVSGDDSRMVGAVARSVGLRGEGRGVRCVDARTLPKDADMVLADSDFSRLPQMMAPGRRVMAVMERVAGLFLVKTCYALLISAAVVLLGMPYPYLPRHLTYVGTLRSASPLSSCRCRPTTSRTAPVSSGVSCGSPPRGRGRRRVFQTGSRSASSFGNVAGTVGTLVLRGGQAEEEAPCPVSSAVFWRSGPNRF